uniref:Tyr recombinase domain-containing protein n=1 Tax=Amphimedon queenslandica TaxID=400682 RepID=A0A1X7TL49_AMPQE
LPPDPKAFYLRPLVNFSLELGKPWYSNVPIGINTLQNMMKTISEKGGLSNVYTNHSLRATATTCLYLSDVPEKVIQEKTGHSSLAGLRAYENTSSDQLKGMAKMLDSATSFQTSCIKADPDKIEVPEKKQEELDDNPPKKLRMGDDTPLKPKQMAQVFSGSLENCVINFYNNSDSK